MTPCHYPEGSDLNLHRRQNLKYRNFGFLCINFIYLKCTEVYDPITYTLQDFQWHDLRVEFTEKLIFPYKYNKQGLRLTRLNVRQSEKPFSASEISMKRI